MSERVDESIPTRKSLLTRLKNWEDQESWREFFDTYWKLIYGTALQAGLNEDEAEEVVQETVITIAKGFREGKYRHDPNVGSFKGWLLNTTRWRIRDQLRKRRRVGPNRERERGMRDPGETPTTERVADPASLDVDAVWERDWEQNLTDAAMDRVKQRVDPKRFQLFHMHVVRAWPARKVAKKLNSNLAHVYYAKHKITALVEKEVRRLEREGI